MFNPFIDIYHKMKQNAKKHCRSISEDWLTKSGFEEWAQHQAWQGKEVILVSLHGRYEPDNCVFASAWFSKFLSSKDYDFSIPREKWVLHIQNPLTQKAEYLGVFYCPIEAEAAWKKRKFAIGLELIESEPKNPDKEKLLKALETRYKPAP